MEWRTEVSIISHRKKTSSDLKQERSFFRRIVNIFVTGCSEDSRQGSGNDVSQLSMFRSGFLITQYPFVFAKN